MVKRIVLYFWIHAIPTNNKNFVDRYMVLENRIERQALGTGNDDDLYLQRIILSKKIVIHFIFY